MNPYIIFNVTKVSLPFTNICLNQPTNSMLPLLVTLILIGIGLIVVSTIVQLQLGLFKEI